MRVRVYGSKNSSIGKPGDIESQSGEGTGKEVFIQGEVPNMVFRQAKIQ